jgi:hypothetical protein
VHRADNLTTFMCRLSWNLGSSTSWNSQGLSRPVMRLLYLYPTTDINLWRNVWPYVKINFFLFTPFFVSTAALILKFGVRWKTIASFRFWSLYFIGKNHQYTLNRGMNWPQNLSWHMGDKSVEPVDNISTITQLSTTILTALRRVISCHFIRSLA